MFHSSLFPLSLLWPLLLFLDPLLGSQLSFWICLPCPLCSILILTTPLISIPSHRPNSPSFPIFCPQSFTLITSYLILLQIEHPLNLNPHFLHYVQSSRPFPSFPLTWHPLSALLLSLFNLFTALTLGEWCQEDIEAQFSAEVKWMWGLGLETISYHGVSTRKNSWDKMG